MSEITDWITAVATAFSTVGIGLAYSQLRMSQKIAQLQFEDGMAKEYRDLVNRLPTKALLGATLSEDEYQNAFDDLFHYIDLSNEQVFLRQQGRVGQKMWDNWSDGIKHNLSLHAFKRAWRQIKDESDSFQEIRRLELSNFKDDPKKWNQMCLWQWIRKFFGCALCLLLLTGVAHAKSPKEIQSLRVAAAQGNAKAQFSLGEMYDNGQDVDQSYSEAIKWYRRAAEQGNAKAQYIVGWRYSIGNGVKKDEAEAVKWYRLAAAQGNIEAQFDLGDMYYKGRGVKQDYAEARKYSYSAAEQGNAEAQQMLG